MTDYYHASAPFALTPPSSSPLSHTTTVLPPPSFSHFTPYSDSQTELRPLQAVPAAGYPRYMNRTLQHPTHLSFAAGPTPKNETNYSPPELSSMYSSTYRRPSLPADAYQAYNQPPQHFSQRIPSHVLGEANAFEERKSNATTRHAAVTSQADSSISRPVSRPDSPVFNEKQTSSTSSGGSIASYLLLPTSISPSGGSLAEFAAKITCLFWFESQSTLIQIREGQNLPIPTARLDTGFLKWVTTILTTTQVSPNVILLALLFIYRLKSQNPSVKGKQGSEFRLLTVALMLGNKFLDDNTYTNKTWAEVSGIAVQEIHVMEVEFLSHMKYNLYTSKEDWLQWHDQLKTFWSYFDRVNRVPKLQNPITLRPLNLTIPPALPSPPNSTSASPPYHLSASPHQSQYNPHPIGSAYLTPSSGCVESEVRFPPRKRSWDEVAMASEPVAKRPYGYHPYSAVGESPYAASGQGFPSLPLPNHHQTIIGMQQNLALASQLPNSSMLSSTRSTPAVSLPPMNWNPTFQEATAPQSRASSRPSSFAFTGSNNPSPINQSYPSAAAHSSSGNQLSPSHYLHQRNSPYKPVRNISTLLVPPPTSQLPQHRPISYDQMHWQPLGRATEQRTGRVPYLHRDVWPNQVQDWGTDYETQ